MDSEGGEVLKRSRLSQLHKYFAQDVTESWADLVLILSCFIAGIIDSAVYNVWSCFVSMQTGNTVYVGLGVSNQPASQPYRWAKSLSAIVFFCVGSFAFSRYVRAIGALTRTSLISSFLIQAAFCFAAAALVATNVVPRDAGKQLPDNFIVLLPLALLSFQSGGQIVMSRVLAYNEVPTIVLTSTYCDLMFDPHLLTAPLTQNAKRNRRFASAVFLVVGAMIGGFLTQEGEIANALWVAGALKVAVAVAWVFWKSKEGSIRLD